MYRSHPLHYYHHLPVGFYVQFKKNTPHAIPSSCLLECVVRPQVLCASSIHGRTKKLFAILTFRVVQKHCQYFPYIVFVITDNSLPSAINPKINYFDPFMWLYLQLIRFYWKEPSCIVLKYLVLFLENIFVFIRTTSTKNKYNS